VPRTPTLRPAFLLVTSRQTKRGEATTLLRVGMYTASHHQAAVTGPVHDRPLLSHAGQPSDLPDPVGSEPAVVEDGVHLEGLAAGYPG